MADLGLLAGIAKGLESGMGSYQDTRRAMLEEAMQKRRNKIDTAKLMADGIEEKPDGSFGYVEGQDPASRRARERADEMEKFRQQQEIVRQMWEAKEGRPKRPGESTITGKIGDAKKAYQALKALETMSKNPEYRSQLGPIENVGSKLEGVPVVGRMAKGLLQNPLNTKKQEFLSQIRSTRQTVGKHKEGGVLRAEDEPKYATILPSETDMEEVFDTKLKNELKQAVDDYNNLLGDLERAGYDSSGFERLSNEKPSGLLNKDDGEAQSAARQKRIQELRAKQGKN